jgi:hypothetical protein
VRVGLFDTANVWYEYLLARSRMCYDGFIYHAEMYSARMVVLFCLYMLVSIYGCESLSVCLKS